MYLPHIHRLTFLILLYCIHSTSPPLHAHPSTKTPTPNSHSISTAITPFLLQSIQHSKISYIHIKTTHYGASIWIDGSLQGKAPLTAIPLKPGLHYIKIWQNKALPYTRWVWLHYNETITLDIKLEPDPKAHQGTTHSSSKNTSTPRSSHSPIALTLQLDTLWDSSLTPTPRQAPPSEHLGLAMQWSLNYQPYKTVHLIWHALAFNQLIPTSIPTLPVSNAQRLQIRRDQDPYQLWSQHIAIEWKITPSFQLTLGRTPTNLSPYQWTTDGIQLKGNLIKNYTFAVRAGRSLLHQHIPPQSSHESSHKSPSSFPTTPSYLSDSAYHLQLIFEAHLDSKTYNHRFLAQSISLFPQHKQIEQKELGMIASWKSLLSESTSLFNHTSSPNSPHEWIGQIRYSTHQATPLHQQQTALFSDLNLPAISHQNDTPAQAKGLHVIVDSMWSQSPLSHPSRHLMMQSLYIEALWHAQNKPHSGFKIGGWFHRQNEHWLNQHRQPWRITADTFLGSRDRITAQASYTRPTQKGFHRLSIENQYQHAGLPSTLFNLSNQNPSANQNQPELSFHQVNLWWRLPHILIKNSLFIHDMNASAQQYYTPLDMNSSHRHEWHVGYSIELNAFTLQKAWQAHTYVTHMLHSTIQYDAERNPFQPVYGGIALQYQHRDWHTRLQCHSPFKSSQHLWRYQNLWQCMWHWKIHTLHFDL